jgi:hypothetical protein
MSRELNITFNKLSTNNWNEWEANMLAFLSTKRLRYVLKANVTKPTPVDPKAPTAEEMKVIKEFENDQDSVAGHIYLAIDEGMQVHITAEERDDPKKMWEKLKGVALQQKPGARYNAIMAQLSLQLQDGESLSSLMARGKRLAQEKKSLRPTDYTLDKSDEEMHIISLLRALPPRMNL